MRRAGPGLLVALMAAGMVAGCGGAAQTQSEARVGRSARIRLTSAFGRGSFIPRLYTCDGQDVSPPLTAAGIPKGAVELVVTMRDRDALGGNFIHWDLAHISPSSGSRHAGFARLSVARIPPGAVLGRNSFGSLGYRGPCPPRGARAHRYEITLYALGRPSGLSPGFTSAGLSKLDVLGVGTLTGRYGRR